MTIWPKNYETSYSVHLENVMYDARHEIYSYLSIKILNQILEKLIVVRWKEKISSSVRGGPQLICVNKLCRTCLLFIKIILWVLHSLGIYSSCKVASLPRTQDWNVSSNLSYVSVLDFTCSMQSYIRRPNNKKVCDKCLN